jgi:hypothetical protein
MAIVYQHRRSDTNEIFYIGIGKTIKRAYQKEARNVIWKAITNKCSYIIEILFENLTWEQACEKERDLIKGYGRRDLGLGSLVNMTSGGDGAIGRVDSAEIISSKRERMLKANPMNNPKSRDKVSESKMGKSRLDMLGEKNPNFKPGVYQKQRDSWTTFINSEEGIGYKETLKVRYKGTLGSEQVKQKATKARLKLLESKSEEEKLEMTKKMNAKIHTCEHCSITTNSGNYKRWHGINCRSKK